MMEKILLTAALMSSVWATDMLDLRDLGHKGFNMTGATKVMGACGQAEGDAGYSVSGAGDINGDGFADMLIGAPASGCTASAGQVYVVYGNSSLKSFQLSNLDGNNGYIITGPAYYAETGASVRGAGDVNGDGLDDILIGSLGYTPGYDTPCDTSTCTYGIVYLVYGKKQAFSFSLVDGIGDRGIQITDNGNTGIMGNTGPIGYAVSGAGDINGDGLDDMLIGSYQANGAYLIYGSRNLSNIELSDLGTQGFMMTSYFDESEAGFSLSGTGDTNGDGLADILLGGPMQQIDEDGIGYGNTGIGYIVYGEDNNSTHIPTLSPITPPTVYPTVYPTFVSTFFPTENPTQGPSWFPTTVSTLFPSGYPSVQPSANTSHHSLNKISIIAPIVGVCVGVPLLIVMTRYLRGMFKSQPLSETEDAIELSDFV